METMSSTSRVWRMSLMVTCWLRMRCSRMAGRRGWAARHTISPMPSPFASGASLPRYAERWGSMCLVTRSPTGLHWWLPTSPRHSSAKTPTLQSKRCVWPVCPTGTVVMRHRGTSVMRRFCRSRTASRRRAQPQGRRRHRRARQPKCHREHRHRAGCGLAVLVCRFSARWSGWLPLCRSCAAWGASHCPSRCPLAWGPCLPGHLGHLLG
mmetsp:Transcript_10467/g.25322  ORF Transcript_10467/g.25322 Transcript_10467/m.25322 type:complete len:209 (-) Transcript_10467:2202-2828(-)